MRGMAAVPAVAASAGFCLGLGGRRGLHVLACVTMCVCSSVAGSRNRKEKHAQWVSTSDTFSVPPANTTSTAILAWRSARAFPVAGQGGLLFLCLAQSSSTCREWIYPRSER